MTGRDHLQACTGLFNPVNLFPCLLKREETVFVFNTIDETKYENQPKRVSVPRLLPVIVAPTSLL